MRDINTERYNNARGNERVMKIEMGIERVRAKAVKERIEAANCRPKGSNRLGWPEAAYIYDDKGRLTVSVCYVYLRRTGKMRNRILEAIYPEKDN